MNEQLFCFTNGQSEDQRLDKFLVPLLPDYSRSRLQGLIKDGFVSVNHDQVTKTGFVLSGGEVVDVCIPPTKPTNLVAEDIPLQIIFENDGLVVVNKPSGMVVHPAPGHSAGTLVNAALAYAPEMEGIGGEQRPGIVHRLDKETSGLILLAKNERMHRWLQDQFRLRLVRKTYLALVDGHPPTPTGRIEAPIDRDMSHRKQMAVMSEGKGREAVTEYFTAESFAQNTLIEAHPLTGRTHQIRLHMAFIGCPVVGDMLYGRRHVTCGLKRHFLHAARLEITLLGEEQARVFEAVLPPELEDVLTELRQSPALHGGQKTKNKRKIS